MPPSAPSTEMDTRAKILKNMGVATFRRCWVGMSQNKTWINGMDDWWYDMVSCEGIGLCDYNVI